MKDQTNNLNLAAVGGDACYRRLTEHPAHLIRRCYQVFLCCFDEAMAGLEVSPVSWIILGTVYSYPNLSVTEVARRAAVDKASCGRAASALEKRGLMRIDHSVEDGRQKILNLTPAGEAVVRDGLTRLDRFEQMLVGDKDSEEGKEIRSALQRFIKRAGHLTRPSIPV